MAQYQDLAGKVAVITGAGRKLGLGEAMAKRLAEEGVKVILTDIRPKGQDSDFDSHLGTGGELEQIVNDINDSGGEAYGYFCDVTNADEVAATAQYAVDTLGALDIWINNAGVGFIMKPILEMDVGDWDKVLDVNLRGTFYGIKFAAEQMVKQGKGGKIINIGSQASKSGFAHASAYTTSKHGMTGLTRVAAMELGPHGINVNQICPNHVTTGLGKWQNQHFSEVTGKGHDKYMQDMRDRIPLGRPGLQQDIAKACAFLCSEQAQYITAEALNVSGGEEYH
ncbi:SDR family NAD(P)-dependent oxidoreductase [Paraferrimonas sp. SM1919]|uniref:SDR family NAD(P)-dependent oxidoreductase n=1 Tax=Paraferrimonas sp. SM1919 TaxID=2662263 RepID=UPI0013D86141|nr:SDR family NAD(P)-dependent oxidoreductase [Paraferrimonas sp. SM1919]